MKFKVISFGLIACILYGVGGGLRADIGILLNPLAEHCGVNYDDVSIAIAVMQLMFGAAQPFFGIIAARTSNRFVLMFGAIVLSLSAIGMIIAQSFWGLMFALGIMFGIGSGALAFGLILTSAINYVGRDNAMTIAGMLNAAAGMGGFVFSPLLQTLLDLNGLSFTLTVTAAIVAALLPIAIIVTSRDPKSGKKISAAKSESIGGIAMFKDAFANRTYRLLFAGFSTCGFHMVIIEAHLFSQFVSYGIDEVSASWAYSVYGIATITGALLSGFLSARVHKGNLLGFYYGFRAVWVLIYLWLLPKTFWTAVLFAIGLGMTGDATVSPTSGLVSENFSMSRVATLIGVLFMTHQVGAFVSAWLGGVLRELTGEYIIIWMLDVALCTFASAMSFRIGRGR